MTHRESRMILAAGLLALLPGCGTPYKDVVREDARGRIDLVNAQLSYDQARQAYETGRFEHAMKQINAAIARSPEQVRYHVLQGRIHLETRRLEAAADSFKHAIERCASAEPNAERVDPKTSLTAVPSSQTPVLAEAHYYSGVVYQRWSNDQLAYEHYRDAFELEPTNVNYLLASAESMIALGQFEPARELVQSRLSYFENNAAMHQLLGQIAQLLGDAPGAAKMLGQARLLNPDDMSLLEELARVQYQAGLYSQSLQSVRLLASRVTAREIPGSISFAVPQARADLLLLEARCLTALDRSADARRVYLELSKLPSAAGDANVWIELGGLAWQLDDYRRVSLCGAQVTVLAPERFEGYVLKAVEAGQRGETDQERAFLREAASRAERAALPHLMLGQRLAKDGDSSGAEAAYAAALRADPTDATAQRFFAAADDQGDHSAGVR